MQRNIFVEISVIVIATTAVSIWVWDHTSFPHDGSDKITESESINHYTTPLKADTVMTNSQRIFQIQKEKWNDGKTLFKSNCASCHNPKANQTGPALIFVKQRYVDAGAYKGKSGEQWLHEAIRNWGEVVKAEYPHAIELNEIWHSEMTSFPAMSDKDIDLILYYVENSDEHKNVMMP